MKKPFLLLQQRPEDAASDNEYEAFLKFTGLEPNQLRRVRVESGNFPPINFDNFSGILLGGGPYNFTDPQEKKSSQQIKFEKNLVILADRVIAWDFPFLAACAIGVVVNQAGGEMSREFGEELDAIEMQKTTEGENDPLLNRVSAKFEAYAGHKEACETLPPDAVSLVSSTGCPNQLIRIKNNIYLSQFHPEFDADGLRIRIEVYTHHGYFPPESAEALADRLCSLKVEEPVKILRNFVKTYQH